MSQNSTDFESVASANSAIQAKFKVQIRLLFLGCVKAF